jgi:hypothetical protein
MAPFVSCPLMNTVMAQSAVSENFQEPPLLFTPPM